MICGPRLSPRAVRWKEHSTSLDVELVVFPSEPQDEQAIRAFLGQTAAKVPSAKSVSVSVLDGTGGTTGAPTAAALRADGFSVVGTGATPSVGPISETIVTYRAGQLARGEAVIASLQGAAVLTQGSTLDGADVTVTTGSDLAVTPTTTATADLQSGRPSYSLTAAVSPVVAVLESLSSSLGTSTASQGPIPWYDPRPCG